MSIPAYPLQWPIGWKRCPPANRKRATFSKSNRRAYSEGTSFSTKRRVTITEGTNRVLLELQRMGVSRDDVVISTDLKLRLDGLPRSDQKEPEDPGAAVYWQDPFVHSDPMSSAALAPRVMAIDQYDKIADNLAAIAATLEAMRAIERHGGALILERAFTGFTALPAPDAGPHWSTVLGVPSDAPIDVIRTAYRRKASELHPDRGGDVDKMAAVNKAYEQACHS